MFNKLVASEGRKKTGFWSPTNMIISGILHLVLVGGLVAAAREESARAKRGEELVDFVEIEEEKPKEPEPEKPKEPEPPPPEPETPPPVAKGFQTIVPPEEPPPTIAPPSPNDQAINAEDFTGQGKEGGVAKGVEDGVAQSTVERETPPDEGTYELSAVEELPRPTNSTHEQFNDPAIRAVRALRFRPAKVNGRPVKVWVEQPITFQVTR